MAKITLETLKKIIREEVSNLHEGADHDSASKVMSAAAKLLSAIETFKENASEKAKAEIGTNLDSAQQILSRIVASPMQKKDVV
jgi:molybdenum-dependent DNA-binding transcriptional regulator ModE